MTMDSGRMPWKVVLCVLFLHFVFLASVFDIYFRSPVIPSARRHAPEYAGGQAPARRVILFVADGLRADSLYQGGAAGAPFIRKVIHHLGRWGVSHTKVPTESRPGHVALLAGMYEDPSAIMKGWQENPVDFDTVFNASRYTWSWGSPDIVPMFRDGPQEEGGGEKRVFVDAYTPEFVDFNDGNPSAVDEWVFQRALSFLARAGRDAELRSKVKSDKVFLFLHLLGLDTNGHTNKPGSEAYARNLKEVDAGVQSIVRAAENFFGHDGRTAYVFTSDHGMTDWGSHGTGMRHETETPIAAWGAGVKKPVVYRSINAKAPLFAQNAGWNLTSTERLDVNQTDVASLMAALLGVGMPQNSAGRLPSAYLDLHPSHLVRAKLANLLQVREQLLSFEERFGRTYFHSPFRDAPDGTCPGGEALDRCVGRVRSLVDLQKDEKAMLLIDDAFVVVSKGIAYYQRYHRTSLYLAISAAYVGFICLLAVRILRSFTPFFVLPAPALQAPWPHVFATLLLCFAAFAYVLLQHMPAHFVLYFAAPPVVWSLLVHDLRTAKLLASLESGITTGLVLDVAVVPFVIVEALIASFFDRRFLSVAVFVNMAWQLRRAAAAARRPQGITVLAWIGCCAAISAFSFQPTVGTRKEPAFSVAAGVAGALAAWAVARIGGISVGKGRLSVMAVQQLAAGAMVYLSTTAHLSVCHAVSWFLFASSLPAVFISSPSLPSRLLAATASLQSAYVLLSVAYEGLFSLFLAFALLSWLALEAGRPFAPRQHRRFLASRDVSTALSFVLFSIASFFGTGNVASVNSFDPMSIQTLVSVYEPFLMGSLLLVKVLLPFLTVACFVYAAQKVGGTPTRALFLMVLLFSDVMALHFFFFVTDQGSWLEIGTSLSHYIITQATVIFLQVLFVLAEQLMTRSVFGGSKRGVGLDDLGLSTKVN